MSKNELQVGVAVRVIETGVVGEIVQSKRGWLTLRTVDGETKVRSNGVETVQDWSEAMLPKEAGPVADDEPHEPEGGDGAPDDLVADDEPSEAHDEDDEDEEELSPSKKMSQQLREARVRYVTAKSASGGASAHNGDDLATALSGCTPIEVCSLADDVLEHIGEDAQDFIRKYAHLNKGQQRMNAGNVIRGRIKRGDIGVDEVLELMTSSATEETPEVATA